MDTLVTKPESSQVKKKKRRKGKDIRGGLRNSAITNSGRLELGEQVYLFARSTLNRIKLESLTFEACFRLPRGFWEDFIVNECGWCNSKRQSMRCNRALRFYLKAKRVGTTTRLAMLDGRCSRGFRDRGGARNRVKCSGLGHALWQYFVDSVQRLRSRADSRMLLDTVRTHRVALVEVGWQDNELPNLEGNSGIQWLRRWRLEHRISVKAGGLQLKVSWRKVIRRCKVLMKNIFRLRFFFAKCHPGYVPFLLSNSALHSGSLSYPKAMGGLCHDSRSYYDRFQYIYHTMLYHIMSRYVVCILFCSIVLYYSVSYYVRTYVRTYFTVMASLCIDALCIDSRCVA